MSIYTAVTLSDTSWDFTFDETEVPEHILFGGTQALSVKKLAGGAKVIDAMGPDHAPLEWSGMFVGESALTRARFLDQARTAGRPLRLSWSELIYTVVISSFKPDYQTVTRIPYTITLEVAYAHNGSIADLGLSGVDEWVAQDMAEVTAIATQIGDAPLIQKVGALQSAIQAVSSFAKATQSTIATVVGPIQEVQSQASLLIATASNTINSVATLGGILPNNPIAKQAANLTSQAAAMTQTPNLLQLQSLMGRLSTNVGATSAASKDIPVAGANLYKLAGEAYGDPAEWATIAKANNLTDPIYQGTGVIKVPLLPDGSGGVVNA